MALDLESREGKVLVALAVDKFEENGIHVKNVGRTLKSGLLEFNKKHGLNLTFEEYASLLTKAATIAFNKAAEEIKIEVEKSKK